jgi:RNA polymerase sigma factor (sigma-70 family)
MRKRNEEGSGSLEADLDLTRRVVAGSLEAWHEFLLTYAELIHHVVRRHLPVADDDEVHGVYVQTLEDLYHGGLRNYSGTVDLRSWLMLVSRRRSIDFLRARFGRNREPKGLGKLSAFDREVFQLFHVDKLPIEVVLHSLDWSGHTASVDNLVASVIRIEETVGKRVLRKLDDHHAAIRHGFATTDAIRYFVDLRVELDWRAVTTTPDNRLMEKEVAERVERIRELLSSMPEEDRRVARLRFEERLSANEIARQLGLQNRRRVYTLVERVKRRLRAALEGA